MNAFPDVAVSAVRAGVDLSLRQVAVMHLIDVRQADPHSRQVKVLADDLAIAKPSISRAADRLQEIGFLNRKQIPEDRRSCVLELTKEGKKFIQRMAAGFNK